MLIVLCVSYSVNLCLVYVWFTAVGMVGQNPVRYYVSREGVMLPLVDVLRDLTAVV